MYLHLFRAQRMDRSLPDGLHSNWDPDEAMATYEEMRAAGATPTTAIFTELFSVYLGLVIQMYTLHASPCPLVFCQASLLPA